MNSVRETLRSTVASLTDAEATKALDFIKRLRDGHPEPTLAELLADEPAILVPPEPFMPLSALEAIEGSGAPASELLVRDRR